MSLLQGVMDERWVNWSGRVPSSDGSDDNVLAVTYHLMQERTAEQFAPIVEFEVLVGTGEVDRLAGTHKRQRLCARCHLEADLFENAMVARDSHELMRRELKVPA